MYIADATATARLTLWQEQMGKILADQSYIFDDVLVKTYMGKKYITTSKCGFTSTITDDIGEVDTTINANTPYTEITSACVGCRKSCQKPSIFNMQRGGGGNKRHHWPLQSVQNGPETGLVSTPPLCASPDHP